jgi:hypothetical protein
MQSEKVRLELELNEPIAERVRDAHDRGELLVSIPGDRDGS